MLTLAIATTAAIVLVCMHLIISPYLRSNMRVRSVQISRYENEEMIDQRALMVTLNEIEFDYNMNKISEEDYKKLSRHYELMIARGMHETERMPAENTILKDDALLQEIKDEINRELAHQRKLHGGGKV